MNKIVAITQARVSSTRLPSKILKTINDKTLLQIHLERIRKSELINELRIATTYEDGVQDIIKIAESLNIKYYQGSVNDVLDRFYKTALMDDRKPEFVVRLTSDCPLIDPVVIDRVISIITNSNYDYVSNTLIPTFPDGVDVEVFKFAALEAAFSNTNLRSDREHVTPYIWRNSSVKGGDLFQSYNLYCDKNFSEERITVDTQEDFEVIEFLIKNLGGNKPFEDYIDFLNKHPHIKAKNSRYKRNEGFLESLKHD